MTEYLYATDGGSYGCVIPLDADYEIDGDIIHFHGEDDVGNMLSVEESIGGYDRRFYWNEIEIVQQWEAEDRDLIETEPEFVAVAREELGHFDIVAPDDSDFEFAQENDAVWERRDRDYLHSSGARKVRRSDKVGLGTSGYDEETNTFYVGLVDTRDE